MHLLLFFISLTSLIHPAFSAEQDEESSYFPMIIGGQEVFPGDPLLPSAVGIIDLEKGHLICTGTLVAPNVVLTAAHCTKRDPRDLAIIFSRRAPLSLLDAFSMNLQPVVSGRVPEVWKKLNPTNPKNWGDIALLKFQGEAPQGYAPASLLTSQKVLQKNMQVTVIGFGVTDGRKGKTASTLRKVRSQIHQAKFSETEITLNQNSKIGVCRGDSGGPLLIEWKGQQWIAGVTSRGLGGPRGACEGLSIFTSTAAHMDFLLSGLKEFRETEADYAPIQQPKL